MAHIANNRCPRQANDFDTWWSFQSGKTYQFYLGKWTDPREIDEHLHNRWYLSMQLFRSLKGLPNRDPLPYKGLHKKILVWQASKHNGYSTQNMYLKDEKQKQVSKARPMS